MIFKKEPLKEDDKIVVSVDNRKRFLRIFLLKRFWFVLLVSLGGLYLFLHFSLSFFYPSRKGVLEYSLSEDINKIIFNIPSAKVDFILWDNDSIKISYELSESIPISDSLEVLEDKVQGTWSFFWKREFSFFNKNYITPYFKIYIPDNPHQSISFSMIYGDLNFNYLEDKEIKGSLLTGDISLKDVINCHGEIQVGWGSINTYGQVEDKEWYTYTGFLGLIPSDEDKNMNLSVFMGSLK